MTILEIIGIVIASAFAPLLGSWFMMKALNLPLISAMAIAVPALVATTAAALYGYVLRWRERHNPKVQVELQGLLPKTFQLLGFALVVVVLGAVILYFALNQAMKVSAAVAIIDVALSIYLLRRTLDLLHDVPRKPAV